MANAKRLREALLKSSKQAVESGRSAAPGVGEHSGTVWLPVAEIMADPDQPRTHIDDEAMSKLVESIRAIGQVEPILVEPLRAAGRAGAARYRCLSGHRRLRAHQLLKLEEIKATIVRDELAPPERLVHEIAANEAREDHTDYDRARFLVRVFADRLGAEGDEAATLERVRYLVNRAFNEFDRTGAFGAESRGVVEACEAALRAIGERRNLRWFHRWGLPLLALDGPARDAAVAGLDARRALTLARLAGPGADRLVPELADHARRLAVPHRELAAAVKDLAPIVAAEGADAPRARAVVDALVRREGQEEGEPPAEVAPKPRSRPRRAAPRDDVASLRRRVEALSSEWHVALPAAARKGKGSGRATRVAELLDGLPESTRHRAERLVRALEAADRELAALLAKTSR